jgi:hypothetical protein
MRRLVWAVAVALLVAFAAQRPLAETDVSGLWRPLARNQDGSGMIGDVAGVPVSVAGRLRAETWSPDEYDTAEWACRPHVWDYSLEGPLSAMRIWPEIEQADQSVTAYHGHINQQEQEITIWMDGRPRPGANALHTWSGFSTGEWDGDTLVVTTTHLKEGYIRRWGLMRSDRTVVRERWRRIGNYLQATSIMYDPRVHDRAVHPHDDDVVLRSRAGNGAVSVRGSHRDCDPAWQGAALSAGSIGPPELGQDQDRQVRHAVRGAAGWSGNDVPRVHREDEDHATTGGDACAKSGRWPMTLADRGGRARFTIACASAMTALAMLVSGAQLQSQGAPAQNRAQQPAWPPVLSGPAQGEVK